MAANSILAGALEWAADGVPVFPCAPNSKRPMTENGFYDASTDPAVVRSMFERHGEHCLIGARMGEASGLFACDFDIYKGGDAGKAAQAFMDQLEANDMLPRSQRHATMSGGLHVIYESKYGYPNSKPSDGVEIKGEGGYIIVPPSKGYSIEDDCGFTQAPKKLVDFLTRSRQQHTNKSVADHENAIISGRDFHDSITSIAAKLSRRGTPIDQIKEKITAALRASVASNPEHDRHGRWQSLISDADGELSRILTSGRDKYDPTVQTERARDNVSNDIFEKFRAASAAAGFAAPPDSPVNEVPKPTADDYGGEWPFDKQGYFAHENIDLKGQRFNVFPVYAENETVIFAADPKAGKTAISLKLAIELAAGRDFGPFKITDQRGVLYYALEGTRAIKLRVEAEKRANKDRGTDLPANLPLFVVERPTNFITAQDENVAKIVAADRYFRDVIGIPMGLIVIDTLTKAMAGADQNSVDDTSALFEIAGKCREAGVKATIVYVHHTGKDGSTRGSSNIEAEVDLVLKCKKQPDGTTLMYIHMARSIDDAAMYSFNLSSYDLGVSEQGIALNAPIVTLNEVKSFVDTSSEQAVRAHRLSPYLNWFVTKSGKELTLGFIYKAWKEERMIGTKQRTSAVLEILGEIFDRELDIVYKGFTLSAGKVGKDIATVTVRNPGQQ